MNKSKIIKIVSGGQTGADRGGLDAAIELGIPHGGWCPKGRLAEDGTIPLKYNLREMRSKAYLKRTEQNVMDSSATVVFCHKVPKGGSRRTVEYAVLHSIPHLVLDLDKSNEATGKQLYDWIENLHNKIIVLNIAGSRESKYPGLQKQIHCLIKDLILKVNKKNNLHVSEDVVEYIQKIELPFFPDLEVACGSFKEGYCDNVEMIQLKNPHNNLDPKKNFIVRASGDSMSWGNNPINDGDLLLMELNTGGTISNQIFMIEYIDEFGTTSHILKRIEKDNQKKYRLISTNKDYPDIIVKPENTFPIARFIKIIRGLPSK